MLNFFVVLIVALFIVASILATCFYAYIKGLDTIN